MGDSLHSTHVAEDTKSRDSCRIIALKAIQSSIEGSVCIAH